jgi:hypothetical protein
VQASDHPFRVGPDSRGSHLLGREVQESRLVKTAQVSRGFHSVLPGLFIGGRTTNRRPLKKKPGPFGTDLLWLSLAAGSRLSRGLQIVCRTAYDEAFFGTAVRLACSSRDWKAYAALFQTGRSSNPRAASPFAFSTAARGTNRHIDRASPRRRRTKRTSLALWRTHWAIASAAKPFNERCLRNRIQLSTDLIERRVVEAGEKFHFTKFRPMKGSRM